MDILDLAMQASVAASVAAAAHATVDLQLPAGNNVVAGPDVGHANIPG